MSYSIKEDGKMIVCGQCGLGSRNPEDVWRRYCPLCRMAHDAYTRLGLESGRPQSPFRVGETVMRKGKVFRVTSNEGYYGKVTDESGNTYYPFHWFYDGEWARRIG